MDQYLSAGCFVSYLIEERNLFKFRQLYLTADYLTVYGQTLAELEEDWITSLRDSTDVLPFDTAGLVRVIADIDLAYRRLWANFEGTASQLIAYGELNRGRLSWRQGRPSLAEEYVDRAESLLSSD
jgi:hypothetical protein